jgi:hypothetical protein
VVQTKEDARGEDGHRRRRKPQGWGGQHRGGAGGATLPDMEACHSFQNGERNSGQPITTTVLCMCVWHLITLLGTALLHIDASIRCIENAERRHREERRWPRCRRTHASKTRAFSDKEASFFFFLSHIIPRDVGGLRRSTTKKKKWWVM